MDRNPAAIQNAAKNFAANGLAHRIGLVAADSIAPLAADPDLLLMNIEWPIMERVLKAGDWRRCRWIILSGFLASRRDAVEGLAAPDCRVETVSACEGWPVMTLQRTPDTNGKERGNDFPRAPRDFCRHLTHTLMAERSGACGPANCPPQAPK